MKAQFTKADMVDDLVLEFISIECSPQDQADYLNHLLINHIPAATYEALRKAMNGEPE